VSGASGLEPDALQQPAPDISCLSGCFSKPQSMVQARAAPAVSKNLRELQPQFATEEARATTIRAFIECYHHQWLIERLDHRTPADALQSPVISTLQNSSSLQFRVVSTENAMALDHF